MFELYTASNNDGGYYLSEDQAIKKIAETLAVSLVTVNVNMPYQNVVYNLENRSRTLSGALGTER